LSDVTTAVVLGASSGVGRAVSEALAAQGSSLVIASRSHADLEALASHLEIVHGSHVVPVPFDLACSADEARSFANRCFRELGRIDVVVVTAAQVDDADSGLTAPETAERLVRVDFLGPALVLAELSRILEGQAPGTIVVCSSIAVPVPRRNNLAYTASKAGLEAFCAGLRHHLARANVLVQVYRLGYVDTSMAAGRTLALPKVSPHRVARHFVRRLNRDFGRSYYPRYWALITFALSRLPWWLYRRLSF
jgi:NAD(P)-dependent dehydrogenase (short-subunit alcohol dehydrogenase family)